MCFHGNQLSWAIKRPVINLCLKYHSPGFICSSTILAPVISSLDEIYCIFFFSGRISRARVPAKTIEGPLIFARKSGEMSLKLATSPAPSLDGPLIIPPPPRAPILARTSMSSPNNLGMSTFRPATTMAAITAPTINQHY